MWIPNSVKDVFTNEVQIPEDNDIATTENVAHVAMLLFAEYIDAATSISESCGGGGSAPSSYWGKTFINATLELESAIQQYQRAEAKLGGAVTTISKKVDTINQHIDKVLENAPTQLKVSVQVNDADWQKIQELFAKERQWMTAQMKGHIREVNDIFLRKRKSAIERYEEADGIFFGHYAQWVFMFFFYIGIICTAVITIAIIGRYCDWF